MRNWKWVVLAAVWFAAVGSGLWAMFAYETTPGVVSSLRERWPDGTALERDPRRPTLVMFVHPHCPCSRASLHELLVLASQCGERVALRIVFVTPPGVADGWERTD